MNRDRRTIELGMREQALLHIETTPPESDATLCVYHDDWHQGVIGLVASRLKEKFWRPALAFAPSYGGELRGSGRSIAQVHLRDALDLVSKRQPHLIKKFGGHAMAAGLTIDLIHYDDFKKSFEAAVRELFGEQPFEAHLETDGSLELHYANADTAELLGQQIWGAGFSAPLFLDAFQVIDQRLVGQNHLKLKLERHHHYFDAIWFGHTQPLPECIEAAYRLDQNIWNGLVSLQLIIEHAC